METTMDPNLYTAATKGDVEKLVQFDPSQLKVQFTPTENTALHVAAQSGHLGCVEEILRKCPSLLSRTNAKGETALHIAARKGSRDIVKVLIDCAKQKGDAEETTMEMLLRAATNEDKDTALHMAVRAPKPRSDPWRLGMPKKSGYFEVVRMLIVEDSEFQHPANNAEETPLYLAAERGYDWMVSDILTLSQNPAYTGPGRNALHAAILSKCTADTIRKLLEWKPELIKEEDDCGWTPLHCAALVSDPEIVKLLLEKDKSVAYIGNADKNGDNKIAIHIAAYRGRLEIMEELLLHCPDCWEIVTGNKGQNILHLAMETAETSVINFILGNPSMEHLINQKDIEGNTPLHLFAEGRNFEDIMAGEEWEESSWELGDWNAFNNIMLCPGDVSESDVRTEIIERRYGIHPSLRNIVSGEKDYITRRKEHLREKIDPTTDKSFEGVKKMGENHLIVAALIATVTFAAGFTVPGGFDGNQGKGHGMAVLAKLAAFKAFFIFNTIAVTCSTSAVFLYVMASLYGYRGDPSEAVDKMEGRHVAAFYLILIAMGAMMVAFITGAYAVLAHSLGLAFIAFVIVSFSFLLHFFEILEFISGSK